jgi:hypothetical protein
MELWRRLTHSGLAATLACSLALAQYPPGQYPPGQYPPGQYPPGQYPPGQYPQDPSTYPYPGGTRLPGGIPMPPIKWPKRTPKEGAKKGEIQNFEGTLRRLAEKELVLESSADGLMRFRLLAKTQFRDKKGESVRDSLLKPGDQLEIQADADDPETARKVILLRPGTEAERTAAARPLEAPSPAGEAKAAPAKPEPAPASAGIPATPSAPAPSKPPAGEEPAGDPVIEAAREAADAFSSSLPDYLVEQVTTRLTSFNNEASWNTIDVISAEVASVRGKEEYRNIRVNGQPSSQPPEKSGTWTTGEFVITLQDILSPATAASFKHVGDERVGSRPALIYEFSVAAENSHWVLVSDDGRQLRPPYKGQLWIDRETRRVLRLEQRAVSIPPTFPQDKAECVIEYGFVSIGDARPLLPMRAENRGCRRGTVNCSKNVTEFRNYRKFGAESTIKFD